MEARRLSQFINGDVDLLKLDVEGCEHKVLHELASSGKLRQMQRIYVEYHHHIVGTDDSLSVTLRLLENQGFGYQLRTNVGWPSERSRIF